LFLMRSSSMYEGSANEHLLDSEYRSNEIRESGSRLSMGKKSEPEKVPVVKKIFKIEAD